ncbi:hypothetical protein WA026_002247 [Henosepilachna vigintioctopunctata]|uniref:CHCH domain-containing protein n=1 Tax=Henosepilachna vigintioctopunctata TaxID=420089 RepID=A0AAW1TU95_9CUCU
MRLTKLLYGARTPQKEPVPFKEILPLKLKRGVSGKGGNTSEVCCIYEMSVLFACLKANEFNQKLCAKEIDSFQSCYKKSLVSQHGKKEKEAKGILVPGDNKLSPRQVNTLLKKFPQFK